MQPYTHMIIHSFIHRFSSPLILVQWNLVSSEFVFGHFIHEFKCANEVPLIRMHRHGESD